MRVTLFNANELWDEVLPLTPALSHKGRGSKCTPTPTLPRSTGRGGKRRERWSSGKNGFALMEAGIGVGIVAVMFGAAMSTLSMSSQYQYKAAEKARGAALADGLMAEIMQQAYEDT